MERLKRLLGLIRKMPKKTGLRLLLALITTTGISVPLLDEDVTTAVIQLLPVISKSPADSKVDSVGSWEFSPTLTDEPESTWTSSEQLPLVSKRKETVISPKKKHRKGAICKDGSRSKSTGQGACSRHGGVAKWVYEEKKEQKQAFSTHFYQTPPPVPSENFLQGFNLMKFAVLTFVFLVLIVMIKKALS